MKESWLAQNPNGVGELSFLFCGRQNCAPGDSVGPAVREHYLLHFCLSGRGVYQAQGRSYAIGPGEGFLILPDEVTSYQADQSEPWTHIWVGFHGSRAGEYLHQCGLGRDHRVYRCAAPDRLDHCVREMMRYETAGRGHELMLQGELYHFLGWIARSAEEPSHRGRETGKEYVELAMEYIRNHFQEDLTVAKLARYVGLNRSYLTTVFQSVLQMSPQQFLMRFQMTRAAQLLRENNLSVGEVARSCGYPDPLTFSKAFKRTLGVTPSRYGGPGGAHGGRGGDKGPPRLRNHPTHSNHKIVEAACVSAQAVFLPPASPPHAKTGPRSGGRSSLMGQKAVRSTGNGSAPPQRSLCNVSSLPYRIIRQGLRARNCRVMVRHRSL